MRVLSGLLIPLFATMRGSFNTGAAANLNTTVRRTVNIVCYRIQVPLSLSSSNLPAVYLRKRTEAELMLLKILASPYSARLLCKEVDLAYTCLKMAITRIRSMFAHPLTPF